MEATLLFCCDRCKNVDHMKATPPSGTGLMLCHRCQFGEWHDQFPEEQYDPSLHNVFNAPAQSSSQSFLGGPALQFD